MLNDKGQFVDGIIFTISLFIIAVIFLSFAYVFPSLATSLNQTGVFNSTEEQKAITNLYNMGSTGINQGFLIFFGGLILVQVASVFFVRYHPIFMVIFFFMIFVNGLLAIYMGNVFDDFVNSTAFSTTLTSQPVMSFVLDHLLTIVIIVDILTLVVLFAKVGEAQL